MASKAPLRAEGTCRRQVIYRCIKSLAIFMKCNRGYIIDITNMCEDARKLLKQGNHHCSSVASLAISRSRSSASFLATASLIFFTLMLKMVCAMMLSASPHQMTVMKLTPNVN